MLQMSMTQEEQRTAHTYDALGRWWALKHSGCGFWAAELEKFRNLLPRGRVLEVGPGGGRDAEDLIAYGYEYVGADVSSTLIDVARERNPSASFSLQSVCNLALVPERFDGFWAAAVLLHLPKSRIGTALAEIKRVTRPRGVGFIALKKGIGQGMESKVNEAGDDNRFFAYYSADELSSELTRAGFDIVESTERPEPQSTWLCFHVRRL